MKDIIQCGKLLSTVKKLLDKLSDAWFRLIDKLGDYGLEVTKVEDTKNGGKMIHITIGDEDGKIQADPVPDKDGVFQVKVFNSRGKIMDIGEVKESDIMSTVTEALKTAFGDNFTIDDKNVKESVKIKVSLSRVCGSKEDTIELHSINGCGDVSQWQSVLDTVVNDDAFVSEIPSTPTSYDITCEPTCDEIEVCEAKDAPTIENAIIDIYYDAIICMANMESYITSLRKDTQGEAKNILQSIYNTFDWNMCTFKDIVFEINGFIPNRLNIPEDMRCLIWGYSYDLCCDTALAYACTDIQRFLLKMDVYGNLFPFESQVALACIINDLKRNLGEISRIL